MPRTKGARDLTPRRRTPAGAAALAHLLANPTTKATDLAAAFGISKRMAYHLRREVDAPRFRAAPKPKDNVAISGKVNAPQK